MKSLREVQAWPAEGTGTLFSSCILLCFPTSLGLSYMAPGLRFPSCAVKSGLLLASETLHASKAQKLSLPAPCVLKALPPILLHPSLHFLHFLMEPLPLPDLEP